MYVPVCVCVRACARVSAHVRVCPTCVRACMRVYICAGEHVRA